MTLVTVLTNARRSWWQKGKAKVVESVEDSEEGGEGFGEIHMPR